MTKAIFGLALAVATLLAVGVGMALPLHGAHPPRDPLFSQAGAPGR
jgi:hypothetical protein